MTFSTSSGGLSIVPVFKMAAGLILTWDGQIEEVWINFDKIDRLIPEPSVSVERNLGWYHPTFVYPKVSKIYEPEIDSSDLDPDYPLNSFASDLIGKNVYGTVLIYEEGYPLSPDDFVKMYSSRVF